MLLYIGRMRYSSRYRWLQRTIRPPSINFKRKDLIIKKYVVEIVERITYKVSLDAASSEDAENAARRLYDLGCLENGELESVSFDVEEKEGE